MDSPLAKNIAFFDRKRDEWIRNGLEGKWATIADESLIGHFDTAGAAYQAGITARGVKQDFIIKQITKEDAPRSNPALVVGAIRVDR